MTITQPEPVEITPDAQDIWGLPLSVVGCDKLWPGASGTPKNRQAGLPQLRQHEHTASASNAPPGTA